MHACFCANPCAATIQTADFKLSPDLPPELHTRLYEQFVSPRCPHAADPFRPPEQQPFTSRRGRTRQGTFITGCNRSRRAASFCRPSCNGAALAGVTPPAIPARPDARRTHPGGRTERGRRYEFNGICAHFTAWVRRPQACVRQPENFLPESPLVAQGWMTAWTVAPCPVPACRRRGRPARGQWTGQGGPERARNEPWRAARRRLGRPHRALPTARCFEFRIVQKSAYGGVFEPGPVPQVGLLPASGRLQIGVQNASFGHPRRVLAGASTCACAGVDLRDAMAGLPAKAARCE